MKRHKHILYFLLLAFFINDGGTLSLSRLFNSSYARESEGAKEQEILRLEEGDGDLDEEDGDLGEQDEDFDEEEDENLTEEVVNIDEESEEEEESAEETISTDQALVPDTTPAPRENITIDLSQEPLPHITREKGKVNTQYYKGPRKIKHPLSKKGLFKITRKKEYLYQVPKSPQNRSASFRVGSFAPLNLQNDNGDNFNTIYEDTTNLVFLGDYEWQYRAALGKFGFKVGSGFFVATGNGRFEFTGEKADEEFTFIMIPTSFSATYYLQFTENQFLVPYGDGGVDAFAFTELRDDNKAPKVGGALAGHVAGGVGLNITAFDYWSAMNLDREYGINAVFLTVEYRRVIGFTTFNFEGDMITAGFQMEF